MADDHGSNPEPPNGGFLPLGQLIRETAQTELKDSRNKQRSKEAEARAKLIAAERIVSGASIAELAKSYGVGTTRIKKALTLAERAGFYEAIEEIIFTRLLPKALAVYELQLDRGNADVARDVLFGTGALKKNPAVEVNVGADPLAEFRTTKATS